MIGRSFEVPGWVIWFDQKAASSQIGHEELALNWPARPDTDKKND